MMKDRIDNAGHRKYSTDDSANICRKMTKRAGNKRNFVLTSKMKY